MILLLIYWECVDDYCYIIFILCEFSCQFKLVVIDQFDSPKSDQHQVLSGLLDSNPVYWGCRIHRLHLYGVLRLPQRVSRGAV